MKAKIGITIIVLAFIVSWNPYWLIFAVPAYIIGVVVLWLDKKRLSTKVGWTIMPVVLWYPGFLLFMYTVQSYGAVTAQKLDFVFPSDFKGTAVVIYNMPCGQPVQEIGSREILTIPNDGILLYQGEIKSGQVDHRYFIKDTTGQLQQLESFERYMFRQNQKDPPPTDQVGVYSGGMGGTASNVPSKIRYYWMSMILSSKDSLESFTDFGNNNQMSEKAEALVRKCVKK